jgi:D-inositol-3-phosphate glycosyltransferase
LASSYFSRQNLPVYKSTLTPADKPVQEDGLRYSIIMYASTVTENAAAQNSRLHRNPTGTSAPQIQIGLLTGCQDRPYAFGLAMALAAIGVQIDVIGSDEIDSPEMHFTHGVHFLNLRAARRDAKGPSEKIANLLAYYSRLMRYAAKSKPPIFHILWNNRVELFDRTLLMAYYKLMGKRVALTAHNVNQARRDAKDSWLNRFTLKVQYRLCDHVFVHTEKMKNELHEDFGVADEKITVIRHPVNDAFPDTSMGPVEAKKNLGLRADEKAILYFGRLRPYKGLEYLLDAYEQLAERDSKYRLIVAGEPKKGSEEYLAEIKEKIRRIDDHGRILSRIHFIRDQDMEMYLKAADVLVLPYKEIFQSGVLFLSYSFGLPVVATDVGSFREEIVEGSTGFLAKPGDVADLARTIDRYFESDLYKELKDRRAQLREYAYEHHSWSAVARLTEKVYAGLLRSTTP